jgi:isopentenyl-diphosphate delta-isomerase
MASTGAAMIIDAVDQTDTPISQISRAEVFRKHANFRVCHVLIFNSKRELLLQRLALTRKRNPGAWGSSVASYLFSSEDYKQAAERRVPEELGITSFSLAPLGKTEMVDDGCLKFIGVFESFSDGPFHYDTSHIDALEFVSIPEVCQMIANAERVFTPTFLRVFAFYRAFSLLRE